MDNKKLRTLFLTSCLSSEEHLGLDEAQCYFGWAMGPLMRPSSLRLFFHPHSPYLVGSTVKTVMKRRRRVQIGWSEYVAKVW